MKPRTYLVIICLAGGAMWWLLRSSAPVVTQPRPEAKVMAAKPEATGPSGAGPTARISARALIDAPPPATMAGNAGPTTTHSRGMVIGIEPANAAEMVTTQVRQSPFMVLGGGRRGRGQIDPNSLVVKPAYAIYNWSQVDEIAQGAGLEIAKESGFIYNVELAGAVIGQARVTLGEDGTAHPSSFRSLPAGDEAAPTLQRLGELEQVRNGSYEVRLVPNGGFGGGGMIWLKNNSEGEDLFVALPERFPQVPGLEIGKIYTTSEMLPIYRAYMQQAVIDIAARKAAAASRPPPPEGAPFYLGISN